MTSTTYAHHFSPSNIPFGIASSDAHPQPTAATRVENKVIYLDVLEKNGVFNGIADLPADVFSHPTLNAFAALGRKTHSAVRSGIQNALNGKLPDGAEEDISKVALHLPVAIGDFTDFSCSVHHVQNAAEVVFGQRSTPPCFFNFPPAYAGRASTIVVSGTPITRPQGQYLDRSKDPKGVPVYGASKALDFELELGCIVGKPLPMGKQLNAAEADQHIFGFVLLNDWSARDIQAFEMNPLGPMNGKNFGTSISPWVITLDALEKYKVPAPPRQQPVIGLLDDPDSVNYEIDMEVEIISKDASTVVGKAPVGVMYWTCRQILAHQASAGCDLRTGDLLGTGTVSGPTRETFGCLMEATKGGKDPLNLSDGTSRSYLQDGDIVRMTGVVGGVQAGVGFGELVGEIKSAKK